MLRPAVQSDQWKLFVTGAVLGTIAPSTAASPTPTPTPTPTADCADCADCQGDNVECIRDNCVLGGDGVCFPPITDADACDTCIEDAGCDAGLLACAGDVVCP